MLPFEYWPPVPPLVKKILLFILAMFACFVAKYFVEVALYTPLNTNTSQEKILIELINNLKRKLPIDNGDGTILADVELKKNNGYTVFYYLIVTTLKNKDKYSIERDEELKHTITKNLCISSKKLLEQNIKTEFVYLGSDKSELIRFKGNKKLCRQFWQQ